ncbi:helix-turn-helix domain-containing protein, partial [Acinetobacter baumannii]
MSHSKNFSFRMLATKKFIEFEFRIVHENKNSILLEFYSFLNMEWTLKEDRVAVIALHRCGYAPIQIFNILKNLNITKRFVYRTIKRYNEDSSVDDRSRSGRPRSVRTPAVIKAVKARIQRNPKRKQKLLALQMGLSRTTVKRVLNEDLGLRAYRRKTGHRLNARLMDLRLKRCRALLKRYAGKKYREILFSDEKIFTVEESYNKQNDKVYAH